MTQLDLSLPEPRPEQMARTRDPETSYLAAREAVRSGKVRGESLQILAVVLREPGLTYREIHQRLDGAIVEPAEVMRRLSHNLAPRDRVTGEELSSGLVKRGPKRACSLVCSPMVTWWPREAVLG